MNFGKHFPLQKKNIFKNARKVPLGPKPIHDEGATFIESAKTIIAY